MFILRGVGFSAEQLEDALATLGEVLEARGHRFEVVAIGGGGLLLLRVIERPTKDLDLVGVITERGLATAEPLPAPLQEACRDVAQLLGLAADWLNAGPTRLLDYGLPQGFLERVSTRSFGGLLVHVADRIDQIHFKLYAAIDQGPRSKHFQDLLRLAPSADELLVAARWTRTHDTSDGFREHLREALSTLGVEVPDDL